MLGWVLFRCDTLAHAGAYYAALAGAAAGDAARAPLGQWLDPLTLAALSVAIVFSFPLAPAIGRWRDMRAARPGGALVMTLDVAWLAVLLLAATAFLAAGTYNPFIYFRF